MLVDNSASHIAAYQRSASVQKTNFSVSGSYLEITGGAAGGIRDGADISEVAKELLDRIRSLDVFSVIYPNSDPRQKTKSLNEVEGDFLGDFYNFSSTYGQMASMMGLDASSSFTMGLDGVGGMTVEGTDSSSASKLQNAFNGNSTMVSRFAVMAARAALVDAGNTVDGFKDGYAQDPVAAITENIDALKERLLGFRTVADGGNMSYGFMRDFEIEFSGTRAEYAVTGKEAV